MGLHCLSHVPGPGCANFALCAGAERDQDGIMARQGAVDVGGNHHIAADDGERRIGGIQFGGVADKGRHQLALCKGLIDHVTTERSGCPK